MKPGITYNERSWAIDLIGHIKQIAASSNRSIKDAGGEQTVRTEGSSLFPDVLLFGDRATALILQGWELKMPDTRIDDYEFIHNAKQKAIALGLDSFLLWNVSHAHLYIRISGTEQFDCKHKWDDLSHVTDRASVVPNRDSWEKLATKIINHINDLFDRKTLSGRPFVEAYKSGGVTALIMENTDAVATAIEDACKKDSRLKAEITLWWESYKSEYGSGKSVDKVLAQANISNWIGKLLFAHILQGKDNRAQAVTEIKDATTPTEALEIFNKLSESCNFWTIFSDSVGLRIIPDRAWDQIKQFNKLLTDIKVGSIEQSQLSGILEATVDVAVRKLRGQYPTPPTLAKLLVQLCMRNIVNDRVLDPCCGSGTIVRAALEQKLSANISADNASARVFAGDQDPQAIQIATFALAKPDLMHMPLRLFRKDAFFLRPDTELEFKNPSTGVSFAEKLEKFDAIFSNLPFVAQDGRKQYGNAIAEVSKLLNAKKEALPKNADIAAYLPFALHPLLKEQGRLGIIITNAWLGTAWGDMFYNLIKQYYNLTKIITSGAGRWFQNSKVVTNILILEKKKDGGNNNESIDYIVLKRPLEELSDQDSLSIAAAQIELGQTQDETLTIRSVTSDNIEKFHTYGLRGNAQFVNCDWVLNLPLVPLNSLYEIKRGERRGWDAMFYPEEGHGIEDAYIKPVLKSPVDIEGYITTATSEAFSCSLSLDKLNKAGHKGAVNWIKRFESGVNDKGKPLVESLAKKGLHWYEMSTDTLADLVMPLNFGYRLFISKLNPPSFVNQRLIRLNAKVGVDNDLCHALLNSAISMFMIEGMGFGRGQGALDLSKDKIEDFMHILNPAVLSNEQIDKVKQAFSPLTKRKLFEVADELEQEDRKHFDNTVLEMFGIQTSREQIYENLLNLVELRQTATETFG